MKENTDFLEQNLKNMEQRLEAAMDKIAETNIKLIQLETKIVKWALVTFLMLEAIFMIFAVKLFH